MTQPANVQLGWGARIWVPLLIVATVLVLASLALDGNVRWLWQAWRSNAGAVKRNVSPAALAGRVAQMQAFTDLGARTRRAAAAAADPGRAASSAAAAAAVLPPAPAPAKTAAESEQRHERTQEARAAALAPPEVQRMRDILRAFVTQKPTQWDALLAMGDIYARGAYPRFQPNKHLALRCFKMAATCPDGEVAGTGQAKYVEAHEDGILDVDVAGRELPQQYGQQLCAEALRRIRMEPLGSFQKPVAKRIRWRERAQAPEAREGEGHPHPAAREAADPPAHGALARAPREPPGMHIADTQNVHDHGVGKTLRANIEALRGAVGASIEDLRTSPRAAEEAVEAARDLVLSVPGLEERVRGDALHVVERLTREPHSGLGVSEVGALRLVLRRIELLQRADLRADLRETLARQLASGVERGHVVCSTGRLARIVGALDGVEEVGLHQVRPLWAVDQEVATLAGRVREDVLARHGEAERAAYEAGGGAAAEALEQEMKAELTARVRDTYVRALGMSDAILAPIVQKYAQGF